MAWWEGVNETRVLIAPEPGSRGNHVNNFLSLRHPKSGDRTSYLYSNGVLQEFHWFKQSYGSWFLGDYVCEDGRLYIATPVDPVFILLPIFEEARMKKRDDPGKFRQLDEILFVHDYPGYQTLASIAENAMQVVCDLKDVGSTKFYRLNDLKLLNWLCYKANQLKKTLPALNKNFAAQEEKDTLFDAISILGEYLKEDPWLKLVCEKFKIDFEDRMNTANTGKLPSPTGNSLASSDPVINFENKAGKKSTQTSRQTKKAKVEKDSHNIKAMFTRAAGKKR